MYCWVGVEPVQHLCICSYSYIQNLKQSLLKKKKKLIVKQWKSLFQLPKCQEFVYARRIPLRSVKTFKTFKTLICIAIHPKTSVSKIDGTTHSLLPSFHRLEKLTYHAWSRYSALRKLASSEKNPVQKIILRQR